MIIIKLGGSVITDKARANKPNLEVIHRVARVLAERKERMILLNGAGSFGHITVSRYGLDTGFGRNKLSAFVRTKRQLLRLQEILLSALHDEQVPAVPFSPSSFMIARSGRLSRVELNPIREFLSLGMIPLFGGDLVPDLDQGWRVVSADQMASWIAPKVGASMIIYGTDVDGLFSSDPKASVDARLIQKIDFRSLRSAAKSALQARVPDVTAGMRGKLYEAERAVRRGVKVVIMNLTRPEDLHAILDGKHGRWTTIVPKRKPLE